MKDQPITSKFTSVNSSKLPRVYNHIDWSQLKYDKVWCKNAFSHYQTFGTPLIVYVEIITIGAKNEGKLSEDKAAQACGNTAA